jgi:hypothetical protein
MKSNRWLVFGGLLTVFVVLCGAFAVWRITGFPAVNRETQRQTYDRAVTKIVFSHLTSNDITVHGRPGTTGVTVERRLRWNGSAPSIQETWDGDTLTISVGCPKWGIGRECGVDYFLDVPPSVAIEADVNSGDITLDGLAAAVRVTTSSGDVRVRGLTGESLDTHSNSGDVTVDAVSVKTLTVKATSGDVKVTLAAAPTTVDASTTSGDVTVTVPRSDMRYKVQIATTSGDVSSDIGNDDSGTGSISVRATSGDVRLRLA